MSKVYLAHPISTRGEFEDSKRVANEIRALGYEVYAAAENDSINDKSNEPTPIDIYNGDVSEIMSSDIFVVNLSGGHQDGTISEIGVVAGLNEVREEIDADKVFNIRVGNMPNVLDSETIPIIAYTSNARLLQPQHYRGMSSASVNHLVLGMVDRWGEFVGSEQNIIKKLEDML